LKKLKFEIFDIFTNNIINVEIDEVPKYVCFTELGEILNSLALRLVQFFGLSILWVDDIGFMMPIGFGFKTKLVLNPYVRRF